MASKRRKMRKPEQIVAKLQSADASHPGPHHGHDPSPDGVGEAVPDGGQLRRDRFGLDCDPNNRLGEAGGAVSGSAWLTGWCVSRLGKIPIPNPEKNREPNVDSGSTPLGALRGWATPTAAPCHWLEHRLHKPGVAKLADEGGPPTHPS